MAAEQFRTTISAVVWTETTDQANALISQVKGVLPKADQDSMLSTIEYKADGRPVPVPVPTP